MATPTPRARSAASSAARKRPTAEPQPAGGNGPGTSEEPSGPSAPRRTRAARPAGSAPSKTAEADKSRNPVTTLAVDIGGTGLKASILDEGGQMVSERVRLPTPYPLSPQKLVTVLADLVKPLPSYDRVSVGFPGMVRRGRILSAPHFVSPDGPGGTPVAKLVAAWSGFDLELELAQALGKPTRVANDADIQGAAVVSDKGFEVVLTLGTGVGTAFFMNGELLPHFEFSQTPFRKGGTYNEELGDNARRAVGHKKWQKRVMEAVDTFRALTFFDRCYIGGGNSQRITADLPEDVILVDNSAGLIGGIKLWERQRRPARSPSG